MDLRNYDKSEILAIMAECNVKQVLTQNGKMKKSSKNGTHLYNWTIPAYKSETGLITCPNASKCVAGCYARSGMYAMPVQHQAHENKLALSRTKGFEQVMVYTIDKLLKKHGNDKIFIRVHDSGDFYSETYLQAWHDIMDAYKSEIRLHFYAYSKMVELTRKWHDRSNFTLIYSYGGLQDRMIDPKRDRHSKVFESETDLIAAGYSDASNNDLIAIGPNNKIGLIYHGVKSYNKTNWNRVG